MKSRTIAHRSLIAVGAAIAAWMLIPVLAVADDSDGWPILTWNEQALATIRAESAGTATAGRLYAMVNVAMYDAVNGIDPTHESALVGPWGAPHHADKRAAAVAAAHKVLSSLFPDRADIYDAQLAADLEELGGHRPRVIAGVVWGRSVGRRVVSRRADDRSSPSMVQPGRFGVGEFRDGFTSAQFGFMSPFGIVNPNAYITAGPPALTSDEYADDVEEVRIEGDAGDFDQEKEEIFRFWRNGTGTHREPGPWIAIATLIATEQELSLEENARLFALLGMSLADAVIVTWQEKVLHHLWRPGTAIREADSDGNPGTTPDPDWTPRNGSFGSSPEYISGQATFAGAGSTVLADFFGSDQIDFIFENDGAIAGPRTFTSFSAAADEARLARIYAGIHFRFSLDAGKVVGEALAAEVLANRLQPL